MAITALLLSVLLIGCGDSGSALATGNSDTETQEISWYHNVAAAFAVARERSAIMMVDVYTEWCTWCDELDKSVYTDSNVIDLSRKLVNLKVNAEDNAEGEALAGQFGVEGYPTILFLNADGKEIDRIGGYMPPELFHKEMKRIFRLPEIIAAAESGEISSEDRVVLAQYYAKRRDFEKAIDLVEPLLNSSNSKDDAIGAALIVRAETELFQNNISEAEKYLLRAHNEYPDTGDAAKNIFYLVITRSMSGDKEGAKEFLKRLEKRFPQQERMIAVARRAVSY